MKKIAFFVAMGLAIGALSAQQIPLFTQYIVNPLVYNPARAGSAETGRIQLGHKKQWADLPGAPSSSILTVDMPVANQKSGVGLTFYADQTHIFNRYGGSFSYAYHLPISEESVGRNRLSLGVSGGFLSQRINFSRAQVMEGLDPALLQSDESSTAFEMAFGLTYEYQNFALDLSAPQLANTTVRYLRDRGQGEFATFSFVNHYLASVRYRIPLDGEKQLHLVPIGMVRGVVNSPLQYDFNLMIDWRESFFGGAGWRSGGSDVWASGLNAFVGVNLSELFTLYYSYEIYGQQALRNYVGDTHEFAIGFKFGETQNEVRQLQQKIDDLERNGFQPEAAPEATGSTAEKIINKLSIVERRYFDSLRMMARATNQGDDTRLDRLSAMIELMLYRDIINQLKAKGYDVSDLERGNGSVQTPTGGPVPARGNNGSSRPGNDAGGVGNPSPQTGDPANSNRGGSNGGQQPDNRGGSDRGQNLYGVPGSTGGADGNSSAGSADFQTLTLVTPEGDTVLIQKRNGQVLRFESMGSVYFRKNSYELDPTTRASLDVFAGQVRNTPDAVVVYVTGNASTEGSNEYNLLLAARRALAVKNYLRMRGVNAQIMPVPYGEEDPIIPQDITEEQRRNNRRVDVLLLH